MRRQPLPVGMKNSGCYARRHGGLYNPSEKRKKSGPEGQERISWTNMDMLQRDFVHTLISVQPSSSALGITLPNITHITQCSHVISKECDIFRGMRRRAV